MKARFAGEGHEIRITDNENPDDGQIDGNGTAGFEEVIFSSPTHSLTLDAFGFLQAIASFELIS